MKEDLISVIIPFYGVQDYIGECLDSVINQTYQNIEILCIDDLGRDDSINIVKAKAKQDSRVKIITHEENLGLGGARNTGIANAKGKYIWFLDSDDLFKYADILEKVHMCAVDSNTSVVYTHFDNFILDDDGVKNIYPQKFQKSRENKTYKVNSRTIGKMPICAWSKLYKKDIFDNKDLRFTNHIHFEDLEFYYKLLCNIDFMCFCDCKAVLYRQRTNSIMANSKTDRDLQDFMYINKSIYSYLKDTGKLKKFKSNFSRTIKSSGRVLLQSSKELARSYVEELKNDSSIPLYLKKIAIKKLRR
ncbi:MAG: glycosyltransferase [Alphaproteobacteria bacterium]|nr:glycosyltransferase [Alphaproteobacteria bacterium]